MSNTNRVFYAKDGYKFGVIITGDIKSETVMGQIFTEDSISHPTPIPVKNLSIGYIEKILPGKSAEVKMEVIRSVNWKKKEFLPSAPQVLALS